jgi:hypothetical protein
LSNATQQATKRTFCFQHETLGPTMRPIKFYEKKVPSAAGESLLGEKS